MGDLAQAIRAAADEVGGLERFRRRFRLPNTTFYALLRGELPAKVVTRQTLQRKLKRAGIPEDLLNAA